jgi:hypothetical protein
MMPFLLVASITLGSLLLLAGFLHLLPKLGAPGRRTSDAFCRAPLLDLPITVFTVAPMIVGPIVAGWRGFAGGVVGQIATVLVWQTIHELFHRDAVKGPRIIKVTDHMVGRLNNRIAIWATAIVTPLFWVVRLAELFVYPILVWSIHLPSYRHGEWVNCSRQKFSGLVGHDLIWCLYCDWMTGVWSLGTEMLRNVESFWCPIRFASGKKCVNCATDFPDIENGWVPADATMADVTTTIERMYGNQMPRAWFGHPVRITVKGQDIKGEPEPAEAVGAK